MPCVLNVNNNIKHVINIYIDNKFVQQNTYIFLTRAKALVKNTKYSAVLVNMVFTIFLKINSI